MIIVYKNDENNIYDVDESHEICKKQYQLVFVKCWLILTKLEKFGNKYLTDTQTILQIMLVFQLHRLILVK